MASEHRAAAHINGFYLLIAAVIGVAGGWLLKSHVEDREDRKIVEASQPIPANKHDETPKEPEAAKKPEPPAILEIPKENIQLVIEQPKAQEPPPQRTYVTMAAYFELFENPGIPPVDVANQYLGKQVQWTAYFYSMDVYPDDPKRQFRVILVSDPLSFKDYLYCYFPATDKEQLAELRKGARVRITGVLSRFKELTSPKIEVVD